MILYVKNMVCNRCIATVEHELEKAGIEYSTVLLGKIQTKNEPASNQHIELSKKLKSHGFELVDTENYAMIERLNKAIENLDLYSDENLKIDFRNFISLSVDDNFISLNKLFAEIEGVTIEKYIINQKIKRVKEYLVYNDLSLGEIADIMHYSNAAQLSAQFKRITGLTPSHFRQLRNARNGPDKIN